MNNIVISIWTTQSEALKAWKELIKCACKVKCGLKCQCIKTELPRTELCKCGSGSFQVVNRFGSSRSEIVLKISVPK